MRVIAQGHGRVGGGGDRRALGRCSGAYPVAQTTLDMPRTHLRNGDIPGAQRQGVRTHQHTRQTPCTHKTGCGTEQRGELHDMRVRHAGGHAVRRLHVVQNPHHFRLVRAPYRLQERAQCQLARKNLPATAPTTAPPRNTRPASTKTPNLGCCERAGRTFSRPGTATKRNQNVQGHGRRTHIAHMKPPTPMLASPS